MTNTKQSFKRFQTLNMSGVLRIRPKGIEQASHTPYVRTYIAPRQVGEGGASWKVGQVGKLLYFLDKTRFCSNGGAKIFSGAIR